MEDKDFDGLIKYIEYLKQRQLTKIEKDNVIKYVKLDKMEYEEAKEFFLRYLKQQREPYFDFSKGELRFYKYTKLQKLKALYIRYKVAKATKQVLPIMRQACNWQNGTCVEMRKKNEKCSCCNDGEHICIYLSSGGCTLDPNIRPTLCHTFLCKNATSEYISICLKTKNEKALMLFKKVCEILSTKNYCLILKDWHYKTTGCLTVRPNKIFEV